MAKASAQVKAPSLHVGPSTHFIHTYETHNGYVAHPRHVTAVMA